MVVCFCLNQVIGTDIAERPIQDEDNTSKKMISGTESSTEEEPNFVYVIQEGQSKFVKVGCTNNPIKRKRNIQVGNFRKLTYILVIELKENSNKYSAEKVAQDYLENNNFATKLVGGGTEWYDTTPVGIVGVTQKVKESLIISGDFKAIVTDQYKYL